MALANVRGFHFSSLLAEPPPPDGETVTLQTERWNRNSLGLSICYPND
jgi:hypothetical protein